MYFVVLTGKEKNKIITAIYVDDERGVVTSDQEKEYFRENLRELTPEEEARCIRTEEIKL